MGAQQRDELGRDILIAQSLHTRLHRQERSIALCVGRHHRCEVLDASTMDAGPPARPGEILRAERVVARGEGRDLPSSVGVSGYITLHEQHLSPLDHRSGINREERNIRTESGVWVRACG